MLESHLHRNHPSRSGCVAPIARHVTDHEEPGTPWFGWVDTAALLDQAQAYELAGSLRHAEAAYSSLIVAATRQEDHAILSVAFRRRAVLAHHAGDSARARSASSSSSRQKVGCMVFIASGRLSTRCAMWSVVEREKQVSGFMPANVSQCAGSSQSHLRRPLACARARQRTYSCGATMPSTQNG